MCLRISCDPRLMLAEHRPNHWLVQRMRYPPKHPLHTILEWRGLSTEPLLARCRKEPAHATLSLRHHRRHPQRAYLSMCRLLRQILLVKRQLTWLHRQMSTNAKLRLPVPQSQRLQKCPPHHEVQPPRFGLQQPIVSFSFLLLQTVTFDWNLLHSVTSITSRSTNNSFSKIKA